MSALSSSLSNYYSSISVGFAALSLTLYGGVFAQNENSNAGVHSLDPINSINESVGAITGIVATSTLLIIGLAFAYFFYNLLSYLISNEGAEKGENVKKMLGSIAVIVIITSLWGLIAFLRTVTGIGQGDTEDIQALPVVDTSKINVRPVQ